jgi:hypothetical protein
VRKKAKLLAKMRILRNSQTLKIWCACFITSIAQNKNPSMHQLLEPRKRKY